MEFKKPERFEYKQIVELVNNAAEIYKSIHSKYLFTEIGYGNETEESLIKGEKNREYLCAYKDKEVIGYASFYLKNNQTVWINMFYINSNNQKQGFGSLFISEIEKIAKKYKASVLTLESDKKAIWAINFYKKNDFQILSDEDLTKFPFDKVLSKPQVKMRYIFGKKV